MNEKNGRGKCSSMNEYGRRIGIEWVLMLDNGRRNERGKWENKG